MVAGKALKRFKGPFFYIGPLRGVMNKKLEKNGFLKQFSEMSEKSDGIFDVLIERVDDIFLILMVLKGCWKRVPLALPSSLCKLLIIQNLVIEN